MIQYNDLIANDGQIIWFDAYTWAPDVSSFSLVEGFLSMWVF